MFWVEVTLWLPRLCTQSHLGCYAGESSELWSSPRLDTLVLTPALPLNCVMLGTSLCLSGLLVPQL